MYREEFEKRWHELKGKVQGKWNKLSNEDVVRMEGKYDHFLSKLQKKYNLTREQAEREIQEWNGEGMHHEPANPWSHGHQNENEHHNHKKRRKAG